MSKPLMRLLHLRQRQKDAAQMELSEATRHMHNTEAFLNQQTVGGSLGSVSGQHLMDEAYRRELAQGHLTALTDLVEQRRHLVAEAKMQERQVELLVEKRAAEKKARLQRREAATLDDWFRASQWQEKT